MLVTFNSRVLLNIALSLQIQVIVQQIQVSWIYDWKHIFWIPEAVHMYYFRKYSYSIDTGLCQLTQDTEIIYFYIEQIGK